MVASTEHTELLEPEIVSDDKVFVAGRNWSSMDIRRSVTVEGHTIKEILLDALRREFAKPTTEFEEKLWLSRCRCKVNGEEIEADKWDSYIPKAGEFVEFLVAPKGGGGGGKNVLSMVLMVAVIALSVITMGGATAAAAGVFGAEFAGTTIYGAAATSFVSIGAATASTAATVVGSMAAMAVMAVGSYAVSKICPTTVSPQQSASSQGAQSSPTYSINGSSNSANPYGYVPLVLGRFRYAGPLGAKSWTKQIGDDQYFNMLVIWGHADMTAKDFRIGDTPLSEFKNVSHIFHGASTGNDLKYFNKSYNEQSIGAALEYNVPVVRYIGECNSISVDIYFPALADASTGETKGTDVTFRIEYALEGTENWRSYSTSTRFFAPEQYIDCYTGANADDAWCTADGTWHISQDNGGASERPASYIGINDPNWETPPLEKYKDKHKHHEWWFRDAWYDAGATKDIVIGAATTSPITRSFEWSVPHGEYKVRITRVSKDLKKETVYDDATWSVARAITNRPAFNTPVPVCCSELRIRASEQLSGYVSDFNALCTSRFPIYDRYDADGDKVKNQTGWIKDDVDDDGTKEYVVGETVNPADHIRYLLTSRHALVNPYTENKIDETSLATFAEYCTKSKYHFNLVCDSEASAWNRLTAVASAGRGAITTDKDGLFGVMVDNADKAITQMFTPRNSWGFSIERAFYTLPHALRVSFYDENDDYKQKEGFIYADGYNKNNATDIIEWSMTGKTNWEDNYRMGRYYLASIKLRPVTVTLSTDWEWMMCRRGDVVGVSHDVLMNTFGTARIVALIYKDDDDNQYYVTREEEIPSTTVALPIGVRIDDTVVFSEKADYGIAIRSKTGKVLTYRIQHTLNAETADLIFRTTITAAQCPYLGALVSVSTMGNETSQYLVAAINVSDNNSAELTLVPWAMPEILNSEKGKIPDWEPPIYLPTIGGKGSLPAPTIRVIKSDETMLKRSGNSLIVCMGVWYELPSGIDSSHGRIFVQSKIALKSKPEETIATNMVDSTALNYIEFTDVNEKETYVVMLRLIGDDSGTASDWTSVEHKVIGRTSNPDAPANVELKINSSEGVEISWEASKAIDVSHYEVTGPGAKSLKTLNLYTLVPVYNQTGTLPYAVQSVDVLGLKSDNAVETIEVLPPSKPLPTFTILPQRGTEVSWGACKTTWNISHYEVEDLWASTKTEYTDPRFIVTPRPLGPQYKFLITAVDIFGNRSLTAENLVSFESMQAPSPSATIDGTQVVISWDTIVAPFAIDVYEVQTQEGETIGKVKGTELRFEAPKAGIHGYRVRGIDIAENLGPWGECVISIAAPKTPTMTVEVGEDKTSIALNWTMPQSDLPVIAFDVVRQWDITRPDGVIETHEEDYGRYDVQALSVPAMAVGEHSFLVRAVDNSGNIGPWGVTDFIVHAPGAVTPYNCRAVYNNVMLYFTEPETSMFRIREYLVHEVEGDYAATIGTVDALFFSEVRDSAGVYTYGITPVDIAGNLGPRATVDVKVDSPPNLILLHQWESLFNGERTNLVLDGRGSMFGPVPIDETWNENIARSASVLGVNSSTLTWEQKVEGGLSTWASPASATAMYVEQQDVGEVIASPTIDVVVTQKTLEGVPQMTCRIEVSEDGDEWRVVSENATNVTTENVRFVRITLVWTGGLVQIQNMYITMNVKSVEDSGTVMCRASDCLDANGEFLPEEEFGTRVNFNTTFIDVENDVEAKPVSTDSGLNPIVVFTEGAASYPTGFRVALLDASGQPVDGEVFWYAKGR